MADFKKLSEVEVLSEVPENANALVEINGIIKRVPGTGLGSKPEPEEDTSNVINIKTAIIKDSDYDNYVDGIANYAAAPEHTYECINMTFEEAYQTILNGEPLAVFGMFSKELPISLYGITAFFGNTFGVHCISFGFDLGTDASFSLYWTADGLSTEQPDGGK